MRFPVVIVACGVLVACGTNAPPRPATSAREQSARFVKPPLVVVRPGGSVDVWVRLDRPLHDNEGRLGDDLTILVMRRNQTDEAPDLKVQGSI